MDYVEPEVAQTLSGLRLALTMGVPGPWSEAAKAVFAVKGVSYVPVAQRAFQPNAALVAWTGHRNAPTAMYNDEPARVTWADITALADRLAPDPPLFPGSSKARVAIAGICHEIAGEGGFGWARRQMMSAKPAASAREAPQPARDMSAVMAMVQSYRLTEAAYDAAAARAGDILDMLAQRLHAQKAVASPYLVGSQLSAADIYWACFAALVDPLPQDVNPMPDWLRPSYANVGPLADRVDPILLAHRDFVYARYLSLPLDF